MTETYAVDGDIGSQRGPIEAGTGLTPTEITQAVKGLEVRGYVTIQKDLLEPTSI